MTKEHDYLKAMCPLMKEGGLKSLVRIYLETHPTPFLSEREDKAAAKYLATLVETVT